MRAFADDPGFQDKFNPRDGFTSFEEILGARLDALIIITQPGLHAPQAAAAMEHGKHVYSAVPIHCVPDGEEILEWCDKLVNLSRRTGMHYMLGETTFFHPAAMYCRRMAAEGAFGNFTYAEGEYFHGFDWPRCDLRKVRDSRAASKAGQEWNQLVKNYERRGIQGGPMHYPTHSISGPVCVMKAHAVKVCCWGQKPFTSDDFFGNEPFSNETALFQMSNGATMRIVEHRECSVNRETFRVYGTKGSFENKQWVTDSSRTTLTDEQMRDPLPQAVAKAWTDARTDSVDYGGHEGSHAYLVHEFVDAIATGRRPAINIWEAARYMAAGVMAHKSAMRDGEILNVPDWGDAP